MTPASDLVECAHCDDRFADTSVDDLFFHATGRCRRAAPPSTVEIPPSRSVGSAFTVH